MELFSPIFHKTCDSYPLKCARAHARLVEGMVRHVSLNKAQSKSSDDEIGMKSVNPFFTPAAKKIKYYCEGETYQTSGGEQLGELYMKRNNALEGQSTSRSSQGMQGLWFA